MNPTLHIQNIPVNKLVQLCLDGDMTAWNDFFRRYNKLLVNQIIKTLVSCNRFDLARNDDVIGNIYEQIVIKIYKKNVFEQLDDSSKLAAWLKTMVKNKTLDWFKSYNSDKNLPERDSARATTSIETPLSQNGDFNYHNILHDEIYENKEVLKELEIVLNSMKELSEKELWVLRLKVMFYNPLIDKEIRELAWFTGKPFSDLAEQIDIVVERLLVKKDDKEKDIKSSARIFHLIRRLESNLMEGLRKQELNIDEEKKIQKKILRRRNRMELLIKSGNSFIGPSNKEIASILGIQDDEAGRISVFLHRARKKLESMRGNKSSDRKK